MDNFYSKVKRNLQAIASAWQTDRCFSYKLACYRLLETLLRRVRLSKLSAYFEAKKDRWILDYLTQTLSPILARYTGAKNSSTPITDAPIWVCWWTGEESAPPLVKQCIRSIRCCSGTHPVNLITQDTYQNFLQIPEHILKKVRDKSICLANFSDYLRFSLLADYGGLWLDATIFCQNTLPEEYFSRPVFTCKGVVGNGHYVSNYRWTSFCFGGHQGQLLFRWMQDAFDAYWRHHTTAIDYLLVDYLIAVAYESVPAIREALDAVPENNPHRDELQAAMNAALPAAQFDAIVQPNTWLYKLSWREHYSETTADGIPSVYGHFLQLDL